MNNKEKEEITKIIQSKKWEYLICERVYSKSFQDVKEILELPQWEDKKFKGLLTSNIWKSNAKDVKEILEMPQWEDKKYERLLTSTIWSSNCLLYTSNGKGF